MKKKTNLIFNVRKSFIKNNILVSKIGLKHKNKIFLWNTDYVALEEKVKEILCFLKNVYDKNFYCDQILRFLSPG